MKLVLYRFGLLLMSIFTTSLMATQTFQIEQQNFKEAEQKLNVLITQAQQSEQSVVDLQLQKASLYKLFDRSDLLSPLLSQIKAPIFSQNDFLLQSRWYFISAYQDYLVGQHSEAEKSFNSALQALTLIPSGSGDVSKDNLAYLENEIRMYRGLNLVYLQEYREAVKILISVYNLAEQNSWYSMLGQSLFFMGDINYALKNYEEALEHYQSAYDVYPKDDLLYLARAKMAIAQMTNVVGDRQAALTLLDEVILSYQQLHNQKGLADAFLLKSYFLSKVGDSNSALDWIEKAVEIRELMNNPVDIANAYAHYSAVLGENNQLEKAVLYAGRAVELVEMGDDLSGKWDAYATYSLLLNDQGKYQEAFNYMSLAERALLAKARLDITSETARLSLEFNLSSEKLKNQYLDQQKSLLEERNTLLKRQLDMDKGNQTRQSWAIGIMLVVILLFFVFLIIIYRLYRINKKLANFDSLTKMHNRRSILALGEREFISSKRYDYPLTVLMLDIDNFKQINDQHGHHAGDRILKHVASICSNMARNCDYLGRIGGEEFLILLPNTCEESSLVLAERLCALVKEQQQKEIPLLQEVTVSIGVCAKTSDSTSLSELIIQADTALYSAKNRGRNQVQVFNHKTDLHPTANSAVRTA